MRQCAYCGKYAPIASTECPHCHEALRLMPAGPRPRAPQPGVIRRGLLYMLLAGVIHHFAGGYSSLALPIPISPVVTLYLTPLLFAGGLGFIVYGLYLRVSS